MKEKKTSQEDYHSEITEIEDLAFLYLHEKRFS